MIKDRHFVFTGLQPWDISIGSNAKDMALEISKDNKVLYFNSPLDVMSKIRNQQSPETRQRLEVLNGKKTTIRQINENLWVIDYPFTIWSVNKIPDGCLFDWVNKKNNTKIASFIQQTLTLMGFRDIIHFIDNDIYRSFYLKELLNPSLSIYYRRDNLLPFNYWKKHACRLEPALIKKSDLIVGNSEELVTFARQYNRNAYDIGQGVDLSAYQTNFNYSYPDDIKDIARPIIGYIGDITSLRLDTNLLYQLAKKNPSLSFVFIGRIDDIFKSHQINTLNNVYFLGMKLKEQVPEYLNQLDVCLNPQILNEITIGNYPRKIDEYLAFGKPILATSTLTMQIFKKYVYLCSSLDDYQAALSEALKEDNNSLKKERITFAHTHSWKNSIGKLYNHIESIK